MKIRLPWDREPLILELPDSWNVLFPQPAGAPPPVSSDELELVCAALAAPSGSTPLRARELAGRSILIIVDDNTRPTPVHRFMHLVLDELERGGADLGRALVMPALGIHTPMTEAEMAAKLGPKNLARPLRWRNHDATDRAAHQAFGTTSRGMPVELNRAVGEADLIVLLGLIEPHLWAGFGGGLKNLFPGLGSAEAIGRHHAIIAEPPYAFNRVGMAPEANSFRLDLEEMAAITGKPIFCLNVVLNGAGAILAAFAGDPIEAHRRGVAFTEELAGRRLERPVDGIIVNSHPMDINFKQSMKGVGNSLPAVKPGGVVMGFLRARRGLDDIPLPEDARPLWLVKGILRLLGKARIMSFLERTTSGLNVEDKFLRYYSMQLIRGYELYFHVPTLDATAAQHLGFFRHFPEPQGVIDAGRKRLGGRATVAVFPEAGATFPLLPGR
jgi:nickel-dependent lactate racemase